MVFPVSQVWAQDFSFTLYFGVQMSSFKITLNFTLGDILSSLFLSLEQPIFSLELASVVVFSGNAKERVWTEEMETDVFYQSWSHQAHVALIPQQQLKRNSVFFKSNDQDLYTEIHSSKMTEYLGFALQNF